MYVALGNWRSEIDHRLFWNGAFKTIFSCAYQFLALFPFSSLPFPFPLNVLHNMLMDDDSSSDEDHLLEDTQVLHVGTPLIHSTHLSLRLNR